MRVGFGIGVRVAMVVVVLGSWGAIFPSYSGAASKRMTNTLIVEIETTEALQRSTLCRDAILLVLADSADGKEFEIPVVRVGALTPGSHRSRPSVVVILRIDRVNHGDFLKAVEHKKRMTHVGWVCNDASKIACGAPSRERRRGRR